MTNKRIAEEYNGDIDNKFHVDVIEHMEWYEKRIKRLEKALTYAMNPNTWILQNEKWINNIVKRATNEE